MTASTTPRTDVNVKLFGSFNRGTFEYVSPSFCRQLERELAVSQDALRKITQIHWGYDGDCGAVRIAEDALSEPPALKSPTDQAV